MTKALLLLVAFVGVAATEDDDFGPRPAGWMTRGSNGTAGGGNKSSGGKAIHVCTVNKFSDAVKNGTTTPLWGTLRRCITDLNKRKFKEEKKKHITHLSFATPKTPPPSRPSPSPMSLFMHHEHPHQYYRPSR